MSGGFFGLVVQPGKTYEQLNELPLRISMASIGPDENGKFGTKKTYLKFRSQDQEFVICCLNPDKSETQLLDLSFEPGDELSFMTIGDCAVHLVGNYMLSDYPTMDDSDDNEDDSDSETEMSILDQEIDSDEASEIDLKKFDNQKNSNFKKAHKAVTLGEDSEDGKESEASEGGSDDSVFAEEDAWMDTDGDNDDEISEIDLLRYAAGVKRKANGKSNSIPPAGKKAKIVEIVDAEEVKNETPFSSKTLSLPSPDSPEVKKNDTASTSINKKAEKQKRKKERKNAGKQVDEKKTDAHDSNIEKAPASTNGQVKKQAKEGNSAINFESAKAVAKHHAKEQKASGAAFSAVESKVNGESSSPAKPEHTQAQGGNQNVDAKQPKKKSFPSGLQFEDITVGNGQRAKQGKRVAVRYIGKLVSNGKMFDANVDGNPFEFNLGKQEVIRGWEMSINGMHVGGTRKVIIPPALAYGSKGSPPKIPPNATLEFEIKLLQVK